MYQPIDEKIVHAIQSVSGKIQEVKPNEAKKPEFKQIKALENDLS